MLRLSVHGGGCSGFLYNFGLDDKVNKDDRCFLRSSPFNLIAREFSALETLVSFSAYFSWTVLEPSLGVSSPGGVI